MQPSKLKPVSKDHASLIRIKKLIVDLRDETDYLAHCGEQKKLTGKILYNRIAELDLLFIKLTK